MKVAGGRTAATGEAEALRKRAEEQEAEIVRREDKEVITLREVGGGGEQTNSFSHSGETERVGEKLLEQKGAMERTRNCFLMRNR